MIPIRTEMIIRRTPMANYAILGANVLAYVVFDLTGSESLGAFKDRYLILNTAWPSLYQFFTYQFMHEGLAHLGGNMLFLWIFGDNVEDAMGHFRFAAFYLICGAVAALTQGLLNPQSDIPMIGASGAISGVLGAYLLLYPRARVRVLLFLGIIFWIAHVPAMFVLGVWFLGQLVNAAMAPPGVPGVAFWAHIGGFVTGMGLVPFFKDKYMPLWQAGNSKPFRVERRRGPWG